MYRVVPILYNKWKACTMNSIYQHTVLRVRDLSVYEITERSRAPRAHTPGRRRPPSATRAPPKSPRRPAKRKGREGRATPRPARGEPARSSATGARPPSQAAAPMHYGHICAAPHKSIQSILSEIDLRANRTNLRALRSRFVTQMTTRGRALHSRNGWGFAAGGGGDSLPDNFLVVPR